MWGSLTSFANKALAALPSKEELLQEVQKGVKVFGDLDSLKQSPAEAAAAQRRLHARDLGLTFATDRLILMGRPHAGTTGSGRVNADSAAAFFHDHFPGKFMVWNLDGGRAPPAARAEAGGAGADDANCGGTGGGAAVAAAAAATTATTAYDFSQFDDQVIAYDVQGHPVPPLGLLVKVCMSVSSWLRGDPANVAVIHCGDGRVCTTAVAACYLAWAKVFPDTGRGFAHVCKQRAAAARRRTTAAALASPSSHRYMKYFNSVLGGVRPQGHMLILTRIIVNGLPALDPDGTRTTLNVSVRKSGSLLYDHALLAGLGDDDDASGSAAGDVAATGEGGLPRHTATEGALKFDLRVPLQGDVVIEFVHTPPARPGQPAQPRQPQQRPRSQGKPRVLFSCAFHTGYVVDNVLSLPRGELDFRPRRRRRRRRQQQQQQPAPPASREGGGSGGAGSELRPEEEGEEAEVGEDGFGEDFCVDLIFSSVEDSNAQLDRISTGAPRTEGSLEVQAMDLSAFENMIGEHSNFWDEIPARREHAAAAEAVAAHSHAVDDAPAASAAGHPTAGTSAAASSPARGSSLAMVGGGSRGGSSGGGGGGGGSSQGAPAPAPQPRRAEIHIEDDDDYAHASSADERPPSDWDVDNSDDDSAEFGRGEAKAVAAGPAASSASGAVDQRQQHHAADAAGAATAAGAAGVAGADPVSTTAAAAAAAAPAPAAAAAAAGGNAEPTPAVAATPDGGDDKAHAGAVDLSPIRLPVPASATSAATGAGAATAASAVAVATAPDPGDGAAAPAAPAAAATPAHAARRVAADGIDDGGIDDGGAGLDSPFDIDGMDAELEALGVHVGVGYSGDGAVGPGRMGDDAHARAAVDKAGGDDNNEEAEEEQGEGGGSGGDGEALDNVQESLAGLDSEGVLVEFATAAGGAAAGRGDAGSSDDDFEDLENYLANLDM